MNRRSFGLPEKESIFDEYIGKYVMIYPQHGSTFAGKLTKIEEGFANLNPYEGGIWHKEKGLVRKMIYKNSKINLSYIIIIEPTTKKNLENYCKFCNKQLTSSQNLKRLHKKR